LISRYYWDIKLGSPAPYAGRTALQLKDIDDDGDNDLFSGDFRGLIHFWENMGSAAEPNFILVTDSLEYIQVSGLSKPSFQDLDYDGDFDLLIGEYWGTLSYFENIGTPQTFDFGIEQSNFAGIDVGMQASPCLIDIDDDNDYDLFIGNSSGRIWFYRNDGDSVNYNYTLVTDYFDSIEVGWYASPELADIDGDGDYDLFIGREPSPSIDDAGNIYFYENVGTSQTYQFEFVTRNYFCVDEGPECLIDLVDIDDDSDDDMFIAADRFLRYYENIGSQDEPLFLKESDTFQGIDVNDMSIFFCDIDADSDYDLFCGTSAIPGSPGLHLFLNQGSPQTPDFRLVSENLVPGDYEVVIFPTLADIDTDDDFDLFICDQGGHYFFYENTGTPFSPVFEWRSNNWQGIDPGITQRCSQFLDIDEDGDLDLLFNNVINVSLYYNQGSPTIPNMVLETDTFVTDLNYPDLGATVMGFDFNDIDADGDYDFFGANSIGGVYFFRNTTGDTSAVGPRTRFHNYPVMDFTIGPNPANPITWISYNLPYPQKAEIAVYNLLGKKVATLASGLQMPGERSVVWNTGNTPSGVYFIRFDSSIYDWVGRIVVAK